MDDEEWSRAGKNDEEPQVSDVELEEESDHTRVSFQVDSPYAKATDPVTAVVLRDDSGEIVAGANPYDRPDDAEIPPGSSEQYVEITEELPPDIDPEATEVYLYFGPADGVA